MENVQIETARRYVEHTGVSLFLTGKAGTGKTTFLHDIDATTNKRHAVVAPTGVAAINAGGVTIHSFFQLPFDPYLPDVKELLTEYQMPERHKSLSKRRLEILRTLELLIIDEVSMVRADLLDAIDMTLRRARHSSRPFGGVQLLLIGDVHQLSPVVTEAEQPYISQVYPSPYFFESKALKRLNYVTIELTKVYRQQDAAFVELLNRVRDNRMDAATLRMLNSRQGKPQKDAITLTTHNRQADAINRRHMNVLHGEERSYDAIITGNFPEKSMPCSQHQTIKVGERVMFIKNDSSGAHRYYNGKLGTVTDFHFDGEHDVIEVTDDDGDIVNVGYERWESMKYVIDPETNMNVQEVDGTFTQYPLQAAWAVTIHKAQGLTFDHVVIDAADAFAFGQVYVALSRCRTLEGLSLSTPLTADVTFDDDAVSGFVDRQPSFDDTLAATEQYEKQYRMDKLMGLFGMNDLLVLAEKLASVYSKLKRIYPDNVERMTQSHNDLAELQNVSERFRNQLMHLDEADQNKRAKEGAVYFRSQLDAIWSLHSELLDVKVDNKEISKSIKEAGDRFMGTLSLRLACLDAVVREGYSVPVVQKAKADFLLNGDRKEKKKAGKKQVDEQDANPDLVTLLRQWRAAKAKELRLPHYMVLTQKALMAIAADKPRTPARMMRLPGIGKVTMQRYGKELLDLVVDFCNSGQ